MLTWSRFPTEVRALQRADASSRVAGAFLATTTIPLVAIFSDGKAHDLAMYFLDWEKAGRAVQIDAVNETTGQVYDSRKVSDFSQGRYVVWTVRGRVRFNIKRLAGPNVAVSGLFIGPPSVAAPAPLPPPPSPTSAQVSFTGTDVTTQGNWKNWYGRQGYAVMGDVTWMPTWAAMQPSGASGWTWNSAPTVVRALQRVSGTGRVAATLYSGTSFNINLNLTDGNTHRLALYMIDWDTTARAQRVEVLDAISGAILDSRTVSGFSGGQYLTWNVRGNVRVRVTRTGGVNAVISGIFID
jgi:hypothetical protein